MMFENNQAGKLFLQMLEEDASILIDNSSYWIQSLSEILQHNCYKESVVSILVTLLENTHQEQLSNDLLQKLWELLILLLQKDITSNALFVKHSLLIMGIILKLFLKQSIVCTTEYLNKWYSLLSVCVKSTNPNLRMMSVDVLSKNIANFTEFK